MTQFHGCPTQSLSRSVQSRARSVESLRGFTILEVVIVLALMMLILGVTLRTDRAAQGTVRHLNTTYEVALFMREAQVRGTSVVKTGADFDKAVGVHAAAGATNELLMFIDGNGDGRYQSGETILDRLTLKDATAVTGCAGTLASPGATCGALHIVFKRPHPDARIRLGAGTTINEAAELRVVAGGVTRTVVVYNTGLISVD